MFRMCPFSGSKPSTRCRTRRSFSLPMNFSMRFPFANCPPAGVLARAMCRDRPRPRLDLRRRQPISMTYASLLRRRRHLRDAPGHSTSSSPTLAARIEAPLAALFIDYGHARPGFGDTLQAVRGHRFADPLEAPGEADLTAHVDFADLDATGGSARPEILSAQCRKAQFLLKLGLEARRDAGCSSVQISSSAKPISPARTASSIHGSNGSAVQSARAHQRGPVPPPPFGDI